MTRASVWAVGAGLLAVVGIVATSNRGLGPRWYPVALAVLAIPQCWLGGKLYELRAAPAA